MSAQPLDPIEAQRQIDIAQRQLERGASRMVAAVFLAWGLAWVVGFGAVYLAQVPPSRPVLPLSAALVIAAVALMGAIITSSVLGVRQNEGARGPSQVTGAIIGNAFFLAFALEAVLGWRLSQHVSGGVMLSYWVAATCLIVGGMGAIAAAFSNERPSLVFSAWTLVVGLLAALVPPPGTLLMGVLGGVGYLGLAALMVARPGLLGDRIA